MTGDALLYGELGRNLSTGQGFVSSFVYPISLAYPVLQTLPQPHVLYHPAYPTLLATAFRLGGALDEVILWTNIVLAWAVLGLVFLLGLRLFGADVATIAAAAMALDTTLASNVRNGGTEIFAMMVVTAAAAFLAAPRSHRGAALAGVLLGVAYLTRPNLGIMVPLAAGALWWGRAPGSVAPLLAGAAVVIVPWVARGWLLMGQPFFSLYGVANIAWDTPSFPGLVATYGTLTPRGLGLMLAEYPGELGAKLAGNLVYYARQAVFTANPVAVLVFVLGLLFGFRASRRCVDRMLAQWVAASAAVTVLLVSLVAREPRYLAPVAPVVVVLGIGWLFTTVTARAPGRVLRALALLAIFAWPAAGTARDLLGLRGAELASRWRDPNLQAVAALTSDSDVIVADIGRGLTWYTGRATIQAPIDRATLERIDDRIVPVTAVYLSGMAAARWPAMYGAPLDVTAYVPPEFAPAASFPDGGRLWRKP